MNIQKQQIIKSLEISTVYAATSLQSYLITALKCVHFNAQYVGMPITNLQLGSLGTQRLNLVFCYSV